MMNRILLIVSVFFIAISCSNLDSVSPDKRSAFAYYYGGPTNYTAADAIEVSDGYVLIGDSVTQDFNSIIVIKTDLNGRTIWRKKIDGASAAGIIKNGLGYLVIGDSIKIDTKQSDVKNQIVRQMRLISLDSLGGIKEDRTWGTLALDNINRTDISGTSVTLDQAGNIVTTSTVSKPQLTTVNQFTQLSAHDPSTLKINWTQVYDQDQKDYENSKSVHYSNGTLIWATSAFSGSVTSSTSFLRIPVFTDNGSFSTFVSGQMFGENDKDAYYSGSDIQPNPVGFGVIGTSRTFTGDNSNIYFIQILPDGTPVYGSEIYIDGPTLKATKSTVDKVTSLSQDEGLVLSPSSDGGFLLVGTTTTTADGLWGSGGKDVFLIKINPFNNIVWYKTFGGTGNEIPNSVKKTSDGGYLISGTLTLAGQSSMFIMKIDSNGDLKN